MVHIQSNCLPQSWVYTRDLERIPSECALHAFLDKRLELAQEFHLTQVPELV